MPEQSPPALQTQQPVPSTERLLSAREAALWLQVNPRTAQVRARRALNSGVSEVRIIAGAYCAPGWWWQKTLARPIKVGKPRAKGP
jgi:hypothetical protein